MKKALFISLFALVGACIGCSNANSEIYKNLQNFKLKNLDDYQAIGVGSIKHSNAKRNKKALRGKEGENVETPVYISANISSTPGYMDSDEPFTLIGQLKNGSVENLSFVNEKTSLDFPINACRVWGDFISFVPGNSSDEPPYTIDMDVYNCTVFNTDNSFTLSKKTGKIYKTINFNEISGGMSGVRTCFKQADGSFLISDENSLCKVYENEDGLNFKFLGNHDYDMRIDKYGNAYVENGIITASDSKLHKFTTYLDGNANIFFDNVNKEIYARLNDGKTAYIFSENGEFVSAPACGEYDDYIYYNYPQKVNYNDPSTWSYSTLENWLENNKDQISNYEELKENNFSTLTREQFLDAYYFDFHYDFVSLLDNGDIVYGSSYEQNGRLNGPEGIYGYRTLYSREDGVSFFFSNDGIAEYQALDQYAYLRKEISPKDEIYKIINKANKEENVIRRGNYLYSLNTESRLYKYSFEEDKSEELILDGYNIKTMDIQNGQIVLTGTDDSFNEFEGCLDQNDQISFEKTKSSDVIVLTPIN